MRPAPAATRPHDAARRRLHRPPPETPRAHRAGAPAPRDRAVRLRPTDRGSRPWLKTLAHCKPGHTTTTDSRTTLGEIRRFSPNCQFSPLLHASCGGEGSDMATTGRYAAVALVIASAVMGAAR